MALPQYRVQAICLSLIRKDAHDYCRMSTIYLNYLNWVPGRHLFALAEVFCMCPSAYLAIGSRCPIPVNVHSALGAAGPVDRVWTPAI